MDLKVMQKKEADIRLKKEVDIQIHKRKFTVSRRKYLKANQKKAGDSKKRYHLQRTTHGRIKSVKYMGRLPIKEQEWDIRQKGSGNLQPAMMEKNLKIRKYFRIDRLKNEKLPHSVVKGMSAGEVLQKGFKSGSSALVSKVEGGEEINESRHILSEAKRPAAFAVSYVKERRKVDKAAKEKIKVRGTDSKMKRNRTLAAKEQKVKLQQEQLKGAIRQRKMSYAISKLTGQGQQDSILRMSMDILKMRMTLLLKKIVQYVLAAMAPLFGMLFMVAMPVLLIVLLLYNSPLALFLPSLTEGGDTPQTVLAGYYQEFSEEVKAEEESSGQEVTYLHGLNGGPVSNFMDTLMVYMVKYGTSSGRIGTVMDEEGKRLLKEVFDEMNSFEPTMVTSTIKVGESLGEMTFSAYCPCVICCGVWAGSPTASGVMPKAEHTLAVDAITPVVPMGTHLIVDGQEYVVEDTGNFTRYGVDFDMYFESHVMAVSFGHRQKEVYLANGDANEVQVTRQSVYVKNLNYEDYIRTGALTEEQEELLKELMSEEFLSSMPNSGIGRQVAELALTKVGCRYSQAKRYEEGYYDCSSLVLRCYAQYGLQLPEIASTQGEYIVNNGLQVDEGMLQPGDLIFYSYENNGEFMNISHVAIYVGDSMQVDARGTAYGVVYRPLVKSNIGLYGRPSGMN